MRTLMSVLLLCNAVSAVIHSLKYFCTVSSHVPDIPEFVFVGMVDGVQFIYYDSNTRTAVPKQDWMKKVAETDPQYWERQRSVSMGDQQVFKADIEILKRRFNQTGGVHILQRLYGCEWDDDSDETGAFYQYSCDGEDFIVFDLKTESWVAPKPQAFMTKLKWDHDDASTVYLKQYLTQDCVEWLKKYVDYSCDAPMAPLSGAALYPVSGLPLPQKSSSSSVTSHSTENFFAVIISIIIAAAAVPLVVITVIGFFKCKKWKDKHTPPVVPHLHAVKTSSEKKPTDSLRNTSGLASLLRSNDSSCWSMDGDRQLMKDKSFSIERGINFTS
ncbi:class I histocompatibility antigen, F10 alpha chain-like isoform 2-T2 [Pholidichthys leucotaenia]